MGPTVRDVRAFCQAGANEPVKASVHAALGTLAAICLAYNMAAFILRRERHLARNVLLYTGICALELAQVRRHLR